MESYTAYQMQSHMSVNGLYPEFQLSYRKQHSTETALLKVHNDILMNMNKQHVTLLILLDLSTAKGVNGTVLSWFKSYLQRSSVCQADGDW